MQIQTKKIYISIDNDVFDIMDLVNSVLGEYETGLQFVNDDEVHDGYEVYNVVYTTPPPFINYEKEILPLASKDIFVGPGSPFLPFMYSDGLTPEAVARLEAEKAA